ncbi:hypothetical protein [Vibrio variabilis]|nr:hypothetical protein [Vibrio variabilis]
MQMLCDDLLVFGGRLKRFGGFVNRRRHFGNVACRVQDGALHWAQQ